MSEIRRISIAYSQNGPWMVRREGVLLAQFRKHADALHAAHRFAAELPQDSARAVIVTVQDQRGSWMPAIVPRNQRRTMHAFGVRSSHAKVGRMAAGNPSAAEWLTLNLSTEQWIFLRRVDMAYSPLPIIGEENVIAAELHKLGLLELVEKTQCRITRKGANALWYHRAH